MRELIRRVRDSFWLLPGALLAGSVALGIALVELDRHVDSAIDGRWPWLFGIAAEGARDTLSTIAASMITVAGVVFSVTIVALSLAANAYSPRVLRTFMRDRQTQAALGVFAGGFAYCLVVLRTIRAGEHGGQVPSLAVLAGMLLALCGVSVLVYFIHHVVVSIQVSTILARIAGETRLAIERLFPQAIGEGEDAAADGPAPQRASWQAVPALRTGYIVAVRSDGLLELARRRDVLLRMELGVGDFAVACQPLASLSGAAGERDADARALDALYELADERTIEQDVAFGVRQILDVAARALSPGIHDPGTAVLCVDHLGALLAQLARRRIPSRIRGTDGVARVIARAETFESIADQVFTTLAHYAADEPEVLARLAQTARRVEHAAPPSRARYMRALLAQTGRGPCNPEA